MISVSGCPQRGQAMVDVIVGSVMAAIVPLFLIQGNR